MGWFLTDGTNDPLLYAPARLRAAPMGRQKRRNLGQRLLLAISKRRSGCSVQPTTPASTAAPPITRLRARCERHQHRFTYWRASFLTQAWRSASANLELSTINTRRSYESHCSRSTRGNRRFQHRGLRRHHPRQGIGGQRPIRRVRGSGAGKTFPAPRNTSPWTRRA